MPTRLREVSSAQVCLAKRRLLTELGHEGLANQALTDEAPEREPKVKRTTRPGIEVAYSRVAPATVLIRTSAGMGSGVIVDERGYVLTNHHVINEFLRPDLTIRVSLELAETGPTGRIVPAETSLEGVVVKADPVRDIALVKIIDPPADLPVATLSPVDPRVGEQVLSIGNAGIGLLWAAKVCNVSRIGDLTQETSMLEAGDCSLVDPGDEAAEATRKRDQCEAQKKAIRQQVEESPHGLSVQTTCAINGGDSGGPLVNIWGEVVGLNESIRFGASTLAFHVHLAELRQFLADIPDDVATIIPNPFCEGGVEFQVDDFDGDGLIDTASAQAPPYFDSAELKPQGTYLFDVRGHMDSFEPSLDHPFAADIALLLKGDDAYAFYDRDGDGNFDFMVRDRKADGEPELAYRIDGTRAWPAEGDLPTATLDHTLLSTTTPPIVARLGSLAMGTGLSKFAAEELLASATVPPLPDLIKAFGRRGTAVDTNDDDKPDMIYGMSAYGQSSVLIDTHSAALQSLRSGDEASPILDPWQLRPQLLHLPRPAGSWTIYDRDGDGTYDLALFGKRFEADDEGRYPPAFATHAFAMVDGQLSEPAPRMLGRSLVRAELFEDRSVREILETHAGVGLEGRGGFPDPTESGRYGGRWDYEPLQHTRQLLTYRAKHSIHVLIDLDRDTEKLSITSAMDIISDDTFDAELAVFRLFDAAWAYYDTDKDGAFDVILFTNDVTQNGIDNAIRLTPEGKDSNVITNLEALYQPELIRTSTANKTKLADIFAQVLAGDALSSDDNTHAASAVASIP